MSLCYEHYNLSYNSFLQNILEGLGGAGLLDPAADAGPTGPANPAALPGHKTRIFCRRRIIVGKVAKYRTHAVGQFDRETLIYINKWVSEADTKPSFTL